MDTPPPPPSSSLPPPPPPGAIPPPPPPPVTPIAPPPPPSSGGAGKKILIVILCIFLFLFLLVGGCVATCSYVAYKKAKEIQNSDPRMTAWSLAITMSPDLTVVSKDEVTGHIKVKNTRTGEVTDLDTRAYNEANIGPMLSRLADKKHGWLSSPPAPINNDSSATQDHSDSAGTSSGNASSSNSPANSDSSDSAEPAITPGKAAALKAAAQKLPSFITSYPQANVSDASLNSFGGITIGNYVFTSSDAPDAISDFYEKKLTAQNFTVAAKAAGTNDFGSTVTLVANRADPSGTCALTIEAAKNGTKVTINFTNK